MFNSPKGNDPGWDNRRWMSTWSFRLICYGAVYILALIGYVVITGKEVSAGVNSLAAVLGVFTTALVSVVLKYTHDASKDDCHKREQENLK